MFGYTGDDLAVLLALLAIGVAPLIEGIKSRGRERLWWWIPSGILGLLGFSWPLLKGLYPPVSALITGVATNPQTWFELTIFLLAVVILGRSWKRPPGVRNNSWIESRLTEQTATLKAMQESKDSIGREVDRLRNDFAARAKELEDAVSEVSARQDWPHETLQQMVEAAPKINRDLIELLDYAVDLTTVYFLDYLIAKAPATELLPFPAHLANDEKLQEEARSFLSSVRSDTARTHRGIFVGEILRAAENEAEVELRKVPPEQRPHGIDQLDLLKCAILARQCLSALAFLRSDRVDVDERIRAHRQRLIEHLRERSPL